MQKRLLKFVFMSAITAAVVIVWTALMLFGFVCTFTPQTAWIYNVTPFIGIITVYCLFREAHRIYKL